MVGAYNLINFGFSNGDSSTSKEEDDVFKDMMGYYKNNNPEMIKIRCAKGSEVCSPNKETNKDAANLLPHDMQATGGNNTHAN